MPDVGANADEMMVDCSTAPDSEEPPRIPEPEDMTVDERAAHALKSKEIGNNAFKAQEWEYALYAYQEGLRYLAYMPGSEGIPQPGYTHGGQDCLERDAVLASTLLTNSAATLLKARGDARQAVEYCTKALAFRTANPKALLRRGQAKLLLLEYEDALKDAETVLALEPGLAEGADLKKSAEAGLRQSKQQEKAMFARMFA
mmetsp:Transcript_62610/g.116470  ORF Transcript_62610/g.116470 Transcript_62610/m.116470 type:complete len:201 (-) Transcript_62610:83-685(-)